MTVLKTVNGRAARVGTEEIDVRIRRVSSTHACMGRLSRISETFSRGNKDVWVWNTRLVVVDLSAAYSTHAVLFFLGFTAAVLVVAVDFGTCFMGLADFLVTVCSGSLGASVTGWGECLGFGGEALVALKTRLPRTT
jgi:hypothetical protein